MLSRHCKVWRRFVRSAMIIEGDCTAWNDDVLCSSVHARNNGRRTASAIKPGALSQDQEREMREWQSSVMPMGKSPDSIGLGLVPNKINNLC